MQTILQVPVCGAHMWLRPFMFKSHSHSTVGQILSLCCLFTQCLSLCVYLDFTVISLFFCKKSFRPCLKFVVWPGLCSIFHPFIDIIPSVSSNKSLPSRNGDNALTIVNVFVFVKVPPGVTQIHAWRFLNSPEGSLTRIHFSWPLWLPVQTRTRWLGPFVLSLAPTDRCVHSLAFGSHRVARRKWSSRQRAAQSSSSLDDHNLPSAEVYLFFSSRDSFCLCPLFLLFQLLCFFFLPLLSLSSLIPSDLELICLFKFLPVLRARRRRLFPSPFPLFPTAAFRKLSCVKWDRADWLPVLVRARETVKRL